MINPSFNIDSSSINAVKAKVELYDTYGSTLVKTFTYSDVLQEFTVSRAEDANKFFGFGICHKLNFSIIDLSRELSIVKGQKAKIAFGDGTNFVYSFPDFSIDTVTRDEETNTLSLAAYDAIYLANSFQVSMLGLPTSYTIRQVATSCATYLSLQGIKIIGLADTENPFDFSYSNGANLEGTESIRQVLNAIAEVTQTIYYIDNNGYLVFKRLDISGSPVLTVGKEDYFSLKSGVKKSITTIYRATELGDNMYATNSDSSISPEEEATQYVRNNPFWEAPELTDMAISMLLNNAVAAVKGLSINQFICEDWAGNYLLEIGDKISLTTEDGGSIISYVLNDTITFDGTLSESTQWVYDQDDTVLNSTPITLSDVVNHTSAKVDKINKEISLVVGTVEKNSNEISALKVGAEEIALSVSNLETTTREEYDAIKKEVNLKVTKEDVDIAIETELSNGAEKVKTSTGFTFDAVGLTVSKSDSEMTTQITEDGMTVSRSGQETLVANNEGVKATNLHATTYLIIGGNSRFEDYDNKRTACFWIGR